MPFDANVYRVMIASPGDVTEERSIVTEAIHGWNDVHASDRQLVLLPVKWETHTSPEYGDNPQTIINRQLLENADILVAIFGTRIGTRTKEYVSGTVEEIRKHVVTGKAAMIYFSDVPVSPSSIDQEQYAAVQEFKKECQNTSLYVAYRTLDQFRDFFNRHLSIELRHPRYKWLSVTNVREASKGKVKASNDSLDEENRQLKSQLAEQNSVIGPIPPFGYFYQASDQSQSHPLCPRCYQEKGHKYPLSSLTRWGSGLRRECATCNWEKFEKPDS
jgi:hypothetical protein